MPSPQRLLAVVVMTTSPLDQAASVPAPVRVLLPDGQELTARLWS
ncbi:hypothetical protein SSPS47_29465 [Streptomyces sp. S4.7]|nr:hypothetical protein [Streptomyces sp. S4.7]QHY99239.1 hypothetical protein SSPS47_29465 [Streptomyces sp. S4.7]